MSCQISYCTLAYFLIYDGFRLYICWHTHGWIWLNYYFVTLIHTSFKWKGIWPFRHSKLLLSPEVAFEIRDHCHSNLQYKCWFFFVFLFSWKTTLSFSIRNIKKNLTNHFNWMTYEISMLHLVLYSCPTTPPHATFTYYLI